MDLILKTRDRGPKVTVHPCPECGDMLGVVYEHPDYPLPHGHGYPAMDLHYRAPDFLFTCRGSGQWVPNARPKRA